MLFDGFLSSLISTKQESDDNDYDSLDEKKSIYNRDNGVFGRLRRSGSNRSLFKLSIKKAWNFSSSSLNSVSTVTPPSPTQVISLWKEQVDSNTKNGLNPSEIHRQEIMFEIIRTEIAFAEDIKFLNDRYIKSIQESGIRLPPNLKKTFTILPDILLLHSNAALQLRCIQAIMYPVVPSIAHIIRELATQFNMYESYLVHHKMAISEIANARKKNNKLGQLVRNLEIDITPDILSGRILTLESLLSKPFQRLCKYPLLIMTLLRATAADHKDHSALRDSYNQVDCALRELQERKSEYERLLENDDFPQKFGSFGRFNINSRHRAY